MQEFENANADQQHRAEDQEGDQGRNVRGGFGRFANLFLFTNVNVRLFPVGRRGCVHAAQIR
jgi:hypothetical protein